ncbi:MAG TPA: hypothetical protein VLY04_18840 [Bryobacteraceae bacterium]|nr:hypothetical protein [Bryobacteraceae bacterium]
MRTIKPWPEGGAVEDKPLTDAERNQTSGRRSLVRWGKVVSWAALAAMLASAAIGMGFLGASRDAKHVCDFLIVVFGGIAAVIRSAAKKDS